MSAENKGITSFRPDKRAKINAAQEGITSLLAKTAKFEGNLLLQEGIKIDGRFIGNIAISEEKGGLFVLSDTGCIEGNIDADRATIAGKVIGRLTAATVVLMPSARIEGEIFYDTLRVADGATINGRIVCRSDTIEAGEHKEENVVKIGQTAAAS